MAYTVHNAAGDAIAGDDQLDDVLKAAALIAGGYVTNAAGEVVYDSPAHVEHELARAEADQARRDEALAEEQRLLDAARARREDEEAAAAEAELQAQLEDDEQARLDDELRARGE